MTVQMRQVLVVPLPGGREVAVYLDSERPQWTGPAVWWWQESGTVLNVGCRIPLTNSGIRVMLERLAGAERLG